MLMPDAYGENQGTNYNDYFMEIRWFDTSFVLCSTSMKFIASQNEIFYISPSLKFCKEKVQIPL